MGPARFKRVLGAVFALSMLAVRPSEARPYTVEDLLRVGGLYGVEATPDGRWLVIQTYLGQDAAGRYGDDAWPQPEVSELVRVDLHAPGPAAPLFKHEAATGYLPGPISPRGDRMVVYRLQNRLWRAGIYDFAKGSATWLGATPEIANFGRFVQWTDNDHILMAVTADGAAPQRIGFSWQVRDHLTQAWRATATGEQPAFRILGSGKYLQWGRPAPTHRLELWTVGASTPRVLGDGTYLDLQVSPDGRYAALLEEEEAIQAPPTTSLSVGTPSRRRTARLVDLTTGKSSRPCPTCDLFTQLLSWSATSHELLVYASASSQGAGLLRLRASDDRVLRVEAANVAPRLVMRPENIPFVRAGWLQNDPLVYGFHPDLPNDRSDWYRFAPDGPENLTADLSAAPAKLSQTTLSEAFLEAPGGVWRIGPAGPAHLVAKDAHVAPTRILGEGIRFLENPDPSASNPVLESEKGVERLGGASWRPVPTGDLLWTDGASSVVQRRDDHGVSTLTLSRPNGQQTTLLTLNRFLAEVSPAAERAVHYEVAGRNLTGWLYLPAGGAPRPLPLVVVPYPGSVYDKPKRSSAPDAPDLATGVQVLAGAGFAVLIPSIPQDKTSSNWSDGITPAILAATDAAIATGLVDPQRLSLLGHSGGGYAVLVAAAQSHRFKAVIAENGPSNLLSDWGALNPLFPRSPTFDGVVNQMPGWAYAGQGHLWADPWEAPERYRANSPFFAVKNIDAAVLLLSADHDFVAMSQSESMFSALYRLNRNAALLSFWGEGHVVSSPANLRLMYWTIIDWLRLNLDVAAPVAAPDGPIVEVHQPARAALDQRRAQASTAIH